jgi:hypothetical protein
MNKDHNKSLHQTHLKSLMKLTLLRDVNAYTCSTGNVLEPPCDMHVAAT